MKTSNNSGTIGVNRIDYGYAHGWLVRSYKDRKAFNKLFSDKKYGGKEKALSLAIAYRKELDKEVHGLGNKSKNWRKRFEVQSNNTGVVGVSRTSKKKPDGTVYECFSVSWRSEPGKQKCTSFSILTLGEKKAFKLAVAHRKKMVALSQQNASSKKTKAPAHKATKKPNKKRA